MVCSENLVAEAGTIVYEACQNHLWMEIQGETARV
jgi:hypothetical protein